VKVFILKELIILYLKKSDLNIIMFVLCEYKLILEQLIFDCGEDEGLRFTINEINNILTKVQEGS